MAKTRCCVCGKEKAVSIDPGTGKPYELQICKNDECMSKAWDVVTKSLKCGVCPAFREFPPKRIYSKVTEEQREQIIQLYNEGCTHKEIATSTGIKMGSVQYTIKLYREGKRK